jgi:hypothetical protein
MQMRILCFVAGSLLAAQPTWSQTPKDEATRSVLATIETLLKAIREGDAASAATVMHPDYRVASWQGSASERHLFLDTRDKELAAIGKLKRAEWEVRFRKSRVSIDQNGMANVWAKYEFYSFGKLHHCGFESYELFRTPEGWRIINFSDTDTPVPRGKTAAVCPD